MKKRVSLLLAFLLLASVLIFGTVFARADFGDYGGDYDYGGGYDSYDSYDYGGNDYDYGGNDYNYGGYNGGYYYGGTSSDSSEISDTAGMVILAVVAVIIAIVVIRSIIKNKNTRPAAAGAGATLTPLSELKEVAKYNEIDPDFNADDFREKVSNLYVRFQNAWTAKNLDSVRPYMTDTFFSQMDRQLDRYRRDGITNVVEGITVMQTELRGWKQENGLDEMIVLLKTRINDYVTDDSTGKVVKGSKTAEKFMTYEWKLVRTTGVTTASSAGTTVENCPNCGAPVNINNSAVCEYCGCILHTDTFDWAVSEIKGVSQKTVGK